MWPLTFTIAFVVLATAERFAGIPTVHLEQAGSHQIDFSSFKLIVVDRQYANSRDSRGQTLIPPTLGEFASTFSRDLASVLYAELSVIESSGPQQNVIFLTLNDTDYFDFAGEKSPEGYTISVNRHNITIAGASPLGVWWGTRTLLQQLLLRNGSLPLGQIRDSPGWGTRGLMLDVARKYFSPDFIIETCAYMSFFKQNTLHLHLSDNLWSNPDLFSFDAQMQLYAAFRLWSNDHLVAGLNKRANESYDRDTFENIQSQCAARGVTILPEIDTPGHSLVISQWKPAIGLSSDYTLLNLSHPDTLPTVKTIWRVFLPWFHSKSVSIGADEYYDSSLTQEADVILKYTQFCNELSKFIVQESSKKVWIWGTFSPSSGGNVSTNIGIQHWSMTQANPIPDWLDNGYDVLNTGEPLYVTGKWSPTYPQVLNQTFIFHGDQNSQPFGANIFDPANQTNNSPQSEPRIKGHLAAQWIGWGPNSTSVLEAYYGWRDGIPALADKQWGGSLTEREYPALFKLLQPYAPAQNLDRRIPSQTSTIFSYDFTKSPHDGLVKDRSGNDYHARSTCEHSNDGVHLLPSCEVVTPLTSKGRNYTLSFSIKPTADSKGPILTGRDSALWFGNGTVDSVMMVTGGQVYALNYTFPIGEWTNVSLTGRGSRTFLAVNDKEQMEFLTKIGVRGRKFVWASMAIEAPLEMIGGGEFEGALKEIKLSSD